MSIGSPREMKPAGRMSTLTHVTRTSTKSLTPWKRQLTVEEA